MGANGQTPDTTSFDRFTFHAQATIIDQFKPGFKAPYSGANSLSTGQENKLTFTATVFAGARLWKGGSIYFNPEISGGSGLSSTLGVAAATNGEAFRIGDPVPQVYLARLFFSQIFAVTKRNNAIPSDVNQLKGTVPETYFRIIAGKLDVVDYFDDNTYSHDPRTQFMSWALMDNGAWDYPANTRGYTPSLVLEYISPKNEIRYAISLLAQTANGLEMDWNLAHSSAHTLEYTHRYYLKNREGAIRFLAFLNSTHMGNYSQSLNLQGSGAPDITATRKYGNIKYGFGLSAEQSLNSFIGIFFRAGWNNGQTESWSFTEIDHGVSGGISLTGIKWKRPDDQIGLAFVASGISSMHRAYLKAGGNGFILGDGSLAYGWEKLAECYYSVALLKKQLFLSGAYQFLVNPGYNTDRSGPVHIFSIRLHADL